MKKRIKITESQYNRILLNEQIKTRKEAEDYLKSQGHTGDLGTFEDDFIIAWANAKNDDEIDFSLNNNIYDTRTGKWIKYGSYTTSDFLKKPDNYYYDYDPQGGIGAARRAGGLPTTGNLADDNIEFMRRFNNCTGKRHDSYLVF